MFVRINEFKFVRIENVVSVEKTTNTASDNYGEWSVVVNDRNGFVRHWIKEEHVNDLINELNDTIKLQSSKDT